jgi:sugar phosphate isomerase/epimerase
MAREISLAALSLLRLPPPEVVRIAADSGFDSVGLRLAGVPGSVDHQMLGNSATRRATAAALKQSGLRVLDVEIVRLLPRHEDQPPHEAIVEAAVELGARYIDVITYDPDAGRAADALAALCDQSGQAGLGCVLEFMGFTEAKTMAMAREIVGRAASPNAGILVDMLHLFRTGGSAASLVGVPPERLPFAQLCDARHSGTEPDPVRARAEAVADREIPGDGLLPLRDVVGALPPGIPLSVEVPHVGARGPAEHARLLYGAARALTLTPSQGLCMPFCVRAEPCLSSDLPLSHRIHLVLHRTVVHLPEGDAHLVVQPRIPGVARRVKPRRGHHALVS